MQDAAIIWTLEVVPWIEIIATHGMVLIIIPSFIFSYSDKLWWSNYVTMWHNLINKLAASLLE